jgi:hypothetical protein
VIQSMVRVAVSHQHGVYVHKHKMYGLTHKTDKEKRNLMSGHAFKCLYVHTCVRELWRDESWPTASSFTLLIFCDMLARSLSLHSLFSHTQLPGLIKDWLGQQLLFFYYLYIINLASQSLSPGSWNLWTYSRNSIPIQHNNNKGEERQRLCWMEGMLLLREYARRTQHNDRLISS